MRRMSLVAYNTILYGMLLTHKKQRTVWFHTNLEKQIDTTSSQGDRHLNTKLCSWIINCSTAHEMETEV